MWVPNFCLPSSAGYTINDYISLLQGAYSAMKSADPTCKVIGGLSIMAEGTLGDAFIQAGGLNYVDIYNLHPYPGTNTPESFITHMDRILGVMDTNGGRKPIWATETGYYAADDKSWIPYDNPNRLSSERQCADYLVRFSAIMLSHGVEKIFWHQGTEGGTNNLQWNEFNPLLAEEAVPRKFYPAQSALANMLGSEPVYVGPMVFPASVFGANVSNLYGYAFQCGSRAVGIAWAASGTVASGPLNLAAGVEAFDIMGNPISQLNAFGSSPIYLVSTTLSAANLRQAWLSEP